MEGSDAAMFECRWCSRKFRARKRIVEHLKICEGSDVEGFECAWCSRKFRARRRIVEHLKTCIFTERQGEEPIKCEVCSRRYKTQTGLQMHREKEHGFVVQMHRSAEFECTYCQRKFGSKEGRRKHLWLKHKDEMIERSTQEAVKVSSGQLFGCVYCEKKFTRKVNRKKHEASCSSRKVQSPRQCNTMNSDGNVVSTSDAPTSPACHSFMQSDEVLHADGEEVSTPHSVHHFEIGRVDTTPSSIDPNMSPTLRAYIRDRPSFVQLRTPDIATPRRARINLKYGQQTVEKYRKKIKILQQDVRRLRDRVMTLEDLIIHLREECTLEHRIADSVADTLKSDLPVAFLEMSTRMKGALREKYSKELRKFALTLHFYSPKAYNYVREEFKSLLPHTNTIRNWYSQVDGEPGFCSESFTALKAKSGSSANAIICNFVMDEMDIRSELTYRNGKCHGYEDLGFGYSDADSVPLAQKAMVFMLVCLNGNWKIPIAYFLVRTLDGEMLSSLVKTALLLVDDAKIIVRSITFDGLGVNLTCFKLLGANLNLHPDFKPWFPHPRHEKEKVFLFLDPCHALKLVRNTLGDYVLVDGEGRSIKFCDIRDLFDLNQAKELYSAPRLTKRHINWRENKMRVRLATQVLSSSVSAALLHAKKKGFQKLQSCDGTAEFCLQFDRMFDMLNCRSVFSKKRDYNIPVKAANIQKFETWCAEAEAYIKGLQIVENPPTRRTRKGQKPDTPDSQAPTTGNDGVTFQHWSKRERRPALEHRRKTGFLGFLMCLRNILPLFRSLQDHGLKYLLTYKVLQDHLETWFSAARSKNGFNNNPNCEQFQAIFKRLLVHHELRSTAGANCEGDDTKILSVPSRSSKKKTDEGRSVNRLMSETYSDDILNAMAIEDFYFDDIGINLDEYQEDVVAHIAGFVIVKLEDKKLCTIKELEELRDPSNQSDLIALKTRGKLTIPAKSIVSVCSVVEKLFRIHESELLHPDPARIAYAEGEILEHLDEYGHMNKMGPHITGLIAQLYLRIKIRYTCKVMSTIEHDVRHTSKKQPIFAHQ